MREFWTVLKVQLDVNFGFSALRYRFRKEKDKIPQTLLMGFAIALAVGSLVTLYSFLMSSIYVAGLTIANPEIVLVTAILGLQLFLLITGIFYVIGVFFYSRDLGALMPLPLKPWQVLGSKFCVVMAYEYLMALPVLLPPMLIYGIGQSAGILYWVKALLIIVVSPAIPMMLASLLAIVLMRFLNIGRRKDLLAIIGGTLATFGILAFNLLTQRFAQNASAPDMLTQLLADQMRLISTVSSAFPPSAWATFALSQSGLTSYLYLLLFIAISALLLAAMLWLANKTYYKSAMRSEEVGKKGRRAKNGNPVYDSPASAGPVKAIALREFKLLLRTPAFAMNCLIGSLIIPVIIPLSLLESKQASEGIIALIRNPSNSLAVTFSAVGLMMLAAIINVTASTSLSREGKTFWMSRMIPVSPQRQVYAKFLISYAIVCAGLLITAVMIVLFLKFNIYRGLLALMLGLLGSIPVTIVNMLPDILKPKLSWTNPYEAVKQNMNVLTAMLGSCVLIGLEVLCVVLLALSGLPDWFVYLAITALLIVLSAVGAKVLSLAANRYYKIEV